MNRALTVLILLAALLAAGSTLLAACGRVGPPIRRQPQASEPAQSEPAAPEVQLEAPDVEPASDEEETQP